MFDFNEAINKALSTWYPKDDPLHFNPHHPLGKLLGEWGELMEDQMKIRYKPNYEPETEKECGDIWYYLRILSYQKNRRLIFTDLGDFYQEKSIEYLIACAANSVAIAFMNLEDHGFYPSFALDLSFSILLELAGNRFKFYVSEIGSDNFELALKQLTKSNWQKLKPGSERGSQWMRARNEN